MTERNLNDKFGWTSIDDIDIKSTDKKESSSEMKTKRKDLISILKHIMLLKQRK